MAKYFEVHGREVEPEQLTFPKASDLALRLKSRDIQHAEFIQCSSSGHVETVVFEVRVEVPNRRVHKILRLERIAATFFEGDSRLPKVEALRKDFPRVPHLNLHIQEFPRDLCLYDERYEELRRGWTASRFVHRVREWLSLNARGELHDPDQSLEPILVDYSGYIILPHDIAENAHQQLFVTGVLSEPPERTVLVTHREEPQSDQNSVDVLVTLHYCQPQVHGVIGTRPQTLADVSTITKEAGLDLIDDIKRKLPEWKENSLGSMVVPVIVFPKQRTPDGPVENYDVWCFPSTLTVRELGIELGYWADVEGNLATLLEQDASPTGDSIAVDVFNPCYQLSQERAARLNGSDASDNAFVCVGAGALGSQILMNLARAGYGNWRIIDSDVLLPHNVARHALDGAYVGWNKAVTVAYSANSLTTDAEPFSAIHADVLNPLSKQEEMLTAFEQADSIFDFSASVAVERNLAHDASDARRVSAFLSPTGTDLVIFVEDQGRVDALDSIEMQYYRALANDPLLANHLETGEAAFRYARSCGDTTSAIPQDFVAIHAGIASRVLKTRLSERDAFAGVWHIDQETSVRHIPIAVRRTVRAVIGDWTVVLDDGFRDKLKTFRNRALPNETGGVLLGSFDLERKILYLVDTLPSPPDSEEKPDLYIRGSADLPQALDEVSRKTAQQLEYIGEWHSHPRGATTKPSTYDVDAFSILTGLMSTDGLPAVMAIAGDDDELSLFIGSIGTEPQTIEGHVK